MTVWAIVQFDFEGIHHYPEAAGSKVFLKYPHRHLFKAEVWIEQFHNNRDIEYFSFRDWLKGKSESGELGRKSCEMMATELADWIRAVYPDRQVKVKVMEDGENGALVEGP